MTMPTSASIILPTFNRRALLEESLESILRQTHRPLEVVVVDDGSTDGTDGMAAPWEERGGEAGVSVVWLRQENRGVSAARNRGLEASSGGFVLFHDSDDLLEPDRIALQIARLQKTGADLCAGSLHRFTPDGTIVSRYTPEAVSQDRLTAIEIKKMHWGTPAFTYRRSALDPVRWDETLSCAEDIDFNFRVLEQRVTVCLEPRAVTRIREHADAVKLQNRPGALEDYWTVHGSMLRHYRDRGMAAHLALEQATLLRSVVARYAAGDRCQARSRFRWIQPFVPGVVSGGVGERLALRWGGCDLFCAIRSLNTWMGEYKK
jgi:succinoglycan biosynthesis protein ExoO